MERRYAERFVVSIPVVVRTAAGVRLYGTVTELACGGAFIRLPRGCAELHGRVDLDISLPYPEPRHCQWRAYVVQRQPDGIGLMLDAAEIGDRLPLLAAEKSACVRSPPQVALASSP